jgi:hypothetical protein
MWYKLDLSLGAGGEKAPLLVYFEAEDNWTGINLVVCADDEAASVICRISMTRHGWRQLAKDNRVEMAWGLSGKPIESSENKLLG